METKLQKGAYCFSQAGVLSKANEWNKNELPQGVVVVPEDGGEHAFIVAPHNTIVAQLSPRKEVAGLITDRESWDALTATKRIAEAYAGMHHDDPDGETEYDFDGAPAADFCLGYSHGRIGAGEWALPTEKQLKAMSEHRRELNACFRAMGCPTLPMGYYWSSIASEDNPRCAWTGVSTTGTRATAVGMATTMCVRCRLFGISIKTLTFLHLANVADDRATSSHPLNRRGYAGAIPARGQDLLHTTQWSYTTEHIARHSTTSPVLCQLIRLNGIRNRTK